MKDIKKVNIMRVKGDGIWEEEDIVVREYPFTIYVNDKELITLLCSPDSLKELTLGFLYSEGLISSLSDVDQITIDEERGISYVYINRIDPFNEEFRGKRTITSGCGKGTVFYNVIDSFRSKRLKSPCMYQLTR